MTRIALVLVLLVGCALAAPARLGAEEEVPRPPAPPPVRPPSVDHSGDRESSTWIDLPNGARVAVGKGVEWQGVRVHLALTWHLVAVDVATDKVLWHHNTSAFWNEVGFREVETTDGAKVMAVELKPGRRARRGSHLRQYHDLKTGAKLEVPGGPEAPAGTLFLPRRAWEGEQSAVAKRFGVLVTSREDWAAVRQHVWGPDAAEAPEAVDFEKEVVLLLSQGNAWNCNALFCVGCWEDEQRILVRTDRRTFQTINGGQKTRPWGACVLPRREGKAYVVELDAQGLIGGPAIWKETWRTDRLPQPGTAKASLPPRSTEPHGGWEGSGDLAPPDPDDR
jgi:hypothetical protein